MRRNESNNYLDVIPWSCCKLNYPLPCFHDEYQQVESSAIFANNPDIVLNSLYDTGCLDVLRSPIERGLIMVILVDVALLILQVRKGKNIF